MSSAYRRREEDPAEKLTSFTKILKRTDLEGSLPALHSEEAASLKPSCYILLIESGLIDMTESVLWPNGERRKLSVCW